MMTNNKITNEMIADEILKDLLEQSLKKKRRGKEKFLVLLINWILIGILLYIGYIKCTMSFITIIYFFAGAGTFYWSNKMYDLIFKR